MSPMLFPGGVVLVHLAAAQLAANAHDRADIEVLAIQPAAAVGVRKGGALPAIAAAAERTSALSQRVITLNSVAQV
jgi:hypothetical protein